MVYNRSVAIINTCIWCGFKMSFYLKNEYDTGVFGMCITVPGTGFAVSKKSLSDAMSRTDVTISLAKFFNGRPGFSLPGVSRQEKIVSVGCNFTASYHVVRRKAAEYFTTVCGMVKKAFLSLKKDVFNACRHLLNTPVMPKTQKLACAGGLRLWAKSCIWRWIV